MYEDKLWHEIISDAQLSGEIITGNYELVYYVAENVGIIGILAYPKRPFGGTRVVINKVVLLLFASSWYKWKYKDNSRIFLCNACKKDQKLSLA